MDPQIKGLLFVLFIGLGISYAIVSLTAIHGWLSTETEPKQPEPTEPDPMPEPKAEMALDETVSRPIEWAARRKAAGMVLDKIRHDLARLSGDEPTTKFSLFVNRNWWMKICSDYNLPDLTERWPVRNFDLSIYHGLILPDGAIFPIHTLAIDTYEIHIDRSNKYCETTGVCSC